MPPRKITHVPTNPITGSPGVGKSTAIRGLVVRWPEKERWAVLVNELGEVAVAPGRVVPTWQDPPADPGRAVSPGWREQSGGRSSGNPCAAQDAVDRRTAVRASRVVTLSDLPDRICGIFLEHGEDW